MLDMCHCLHLIMVMMIQYNKCQSFVVFEAKNLRKYRINNEGGG